MAAKPPIVPSYCIHKARNQAYVRLNGVMVYLGVPNSPDSKTKYDRLIGEWMQCGRTYIKPSDQLTISVNEALLAYRRHAATEFIHQDDGTPRPELERINRSLRPAMDLYGITPATEFGPKKLQAIRDHITNTGVKRGTVNSRIKTIRRAFQWAVSQELIPANIYHALQTVTGLRAGHTKAPESVLGHCVQ